MKKVIITDCDFESLSSEQAMCQLNNAELSVLQCQQPEQLIRHCSDADALIVQYATINRDVIASLKHCKIIVRYGVGLDSIDTQAARQRGIAVSNVPDYGVNEVADHTVALCLSLARQLPDFDHQIRNGDWPTETTTPLRSLQESTFATLGAGNIGRTVLQRMSSFGCELLSYDPNITQQQLDPLNTRKASLEEIIECADILSLHLPLNNETRHLINRVQLEKMKSTALLINTSRGALIDTQALSDALETGDIAYAGIDVFETEPLELSHPLRKRPNALLTPHMAFYSTASLRRLQQSVADEVARALNDEPLKHCVV